MNWPHGGGKILGWGENLKIKIRGPSTWLYMSEKDR